MHHFGTDLNFPRHSEHRFIPSILSVLIPSTSHVVQRLTQSLSSFHYYEQHNIITLLGPNAREVIRASLPAKHNITMGYTHHNMKFGIMLSLICLFSQLIYKFKALAHCKNTKLVEIPPSQFTSRLDTKSTDINLKLILWLSCFWGLIFSDFVGVRTPNPNDPVTEAPSGPRLSRHQLFT